jgi:hypothetical protein
MAIDSLGSSTAVSFSQYSVTSATVAPAQGDSDGSAGAPSVPPSGGRFANAIEQTLAQLGGSGATSSTSSSSSTSGSSSTQDPSQAEHAFAQSLFSALQSQFGSQQHAQGAQGEGGGGHHHHHGGGGGGRIASALDSLAQSLSSSSSSGDTSSSSSTSSASSDLQTSFNNLLAATGQSGSSTTLPQFLQSLAQNLQGGSNSGNLLSVKV